MAGDISVLYICADDETNTVLEEHYVGKMRYDNFEHPNIFSMWEWVYIGHDGTFRYNERRDQLMGNRYTSYSLLTDKVIDEMKRNIKNHVPETKGEKQAYEETTYAKEFIDEMKEKYKDTPHNFLFLTQHD